MGHELILFLFLKQNPSYFISVENAKIKVRNRNVEIKWVSEFCVENHCYAIALHFVYYNFCRIHKSLRVTPAMEAKLTTKPMTIEDIVNYAYADEIEAANKRKERMTRK